MYNSVVEETIINIYSFGFEDLSDKKVELEALGSGRSSYEYADFDNFEELVQVSSQNPYNLYLFNIKDKNEFVLVTKFLKQLQKDEIIFKGICFFDFDNPKAENLLLKYGISNIFKYDASTKNFTIKTNMLLRALTQNIKEVGSNLKFKNIKTNSLDNKQEETAKKKLGIGLRKKNNPFRGFSLASQVQVGELSSYSPLKALKKAKFFTAIDPGRNPKVLDYVNRMGKAGKLNIENGELAIKSSLGENLDCLFEEFENDELTLNITGHVEVKLNDPVSVFAKFIYEKFKVEIELDGAVKEIERYDTNSRYITLKLDESCEVQKEHFLSIYEKRQKSIDQFMELAKGIA